MANRKIILRDNPPIEEGRYKVYWNINDAEKKFYIAVHDSEAQTEGSDTDKLPPTKVIIKNKKSFSFKINSNGPTERKSVGEPVAHKTKPINRYQAIYNFVFDYDDFIDGENTISIFASDLMNNNFIGTIRFFTKNEDLATSIKLERPGTKTTPDQQLWDKLKLGNSKTILDFKEYEDFINKILDRDDSNLLTNSLKQKKFERNEAILRSPFIHSEEYNLIKFGTEFFMLSKLGVPIRETTGYFSSGKLPYYDLVIKKISDGLLPNPGETENGDNFLRSQNR